VDEVGGYPPTSAFDDNATLKLSPSYTLSKNILQPTKPETLTAWQIHPKRRAYIWGSERG